MVTPLVVAAFLLAQSSTRPSQHGSVTQQIAGTTVTVEYNRPVARGRDLFGSLVPYDRVWCPGADEATTLESTRNLQVGDLTVPAGSHTIWIRPTAGTWTLIVSKEPSGFHTNYNASADLGAVEMTKRALENPVEQLTFAVAKNPAGHGGIVAMSWETTEVSVPFAVQ